MGPKRLCERGHENYLPHRALCLRWHVLALSVERGADVDQLMFEIDVSPVKAQEFALAESTEEGCGQGGFGSAVPLLPRGARFPRD
jgi:hypothetical protein